MPGRLAALILAILLALPAAAANVLHRGNLAEPDTLDPQKFFTTYEAEILRDLFSGLLQLDAKGAPIAGAAQSWTISPDGLTLTFALRADGKWSDGAPVVAADFVAGFRRAIDPKTASPYANFAYPIREARRIAAGELPPDRLGVRAVDARTFEVVLEAPSSTLLWLFGAFPIFFPIPTHLEGGDAGARTADGALVSNGPYMLASWRPNERIRLTRNSGYFDAAAIAIDEVNYYPTDDDAAAVKRFRAGELDLNLRFPPGVAAALRRDLPTQTRTHPGSWLSYIVLNQRDPRFADARVRRALSIAIDRETLVKRVLGDGELPAWSIVPGAVPGFESSGAGDFSALSANARRAEARRLLAEAGYGGDRRLAFTFSFRIGEANKRAALAIAEMWRAVGVEPRVEANEVKVHYARLREGDFDVADGGWVAPPDPEFFMYLLRTDAVEMNFGAWSNAGFDRLTGLATRELDPARRARLFTDAERIAMTEMGLIPTFVPVERALVQDWVKGFEPNVTGIHPSRWMRIER